MEKLTENNIKASPSSIQTMRRRLEKMISYIYIYLCTVVGTNSSNRYTLVSTNIDTEGSEGKRFAGEVL